MHKVRLTNEKLRSLIPRRPGVYFFKDIRGVPVYIGKAARLRDRVWQHLTDTKNPKEVRIRESATSIEWRETNSDFESLLFEARCIRKYRPKYNIDLKDDRSSVCIAMSNDNLPRIHIVRERVMDKKNYTYLLGPFGSARLARYLVSCLRKSIPFCTQLKRYNGPCFSSHLNQCAPCPGSIVRTTDPFARRLMEVHYKKNIRRLIRVLNGNGTQVIHEMRKEMRLASAQLHYEEAALIRNRIEELEYLFERRLLYDDRLEDPLFLEHLRNQEQQALGQLLAVRDLKKIECFDVSTFSARESVASCVVFVDGVPEPSLYRRFRIRKKNDFDPQMLSEVVERRLAHKDWPWPDLIIIDGGKPQLQYIVPAMKKKYPRAPRMIGIAKHPDRLVDGFSLEKIDLASFDDALHLVQRIRDEAHRFAKSYHVSLRKKVSLPL